VHVLTKIFIVLVSLLAVLLVPLVVVYAYNENSFQARYQEAEDQAAAARVSLQSAKASHGAAESRLNGTIQELTSQRDVLRSQVIQQETEVRRLETRLAAAESNNAEIDAKLATLAEAVDAGQQLTASVIEELRELRQRALAAERQKVELDEALRDALAKLDVAVEARRALQEQLQRMRDEQARALDTIQQYVALYGPLDDRNVAVGSIVDKALDATVVSVRRSDDQVLAEIDAGSRDGVERGWELSIGRGGEFIARLRIIEVDINRSTGAVELEDRTGLRVQVGDRAMARPER
jgi:chromosome segregation ATPase